MASRSKSRALTRSTSPLTSDSAVEGMLIPVWVATSPLPWRSSRAWLTTSTDIPARRARRTRRSNSSDLPANIGPHTTCRRALPRRGRFRSAIPSTVALHPSASCTVVVSPEPPARAPPAAASPQPCTATSPQPCTAASPHQCNESAHRGPLPAPVTGYCPLDGEHLTVAGHFQHGRPRGFPGVLGERRVDLAVPDDRGPGHHQPCSGVLLGAVHQLHVQVRHRGVAGISYPPDHRTGLYALALAVSTAPLQVGVRGERAVVVLDDHMVPQHGPGAPEFAQHCLRGEHVDQRRPGVAGAVVAAIRSEERRVGDEWRKWSARRN